MSTPPLRVLVIGYGPVGARFAENLLPAVRSGDIALSVVGAEQSDAYNRVLVAEYAVGKVSRDALTIADRAAVESAGGCVITGVAVTEIDRTARAAVLSDGRRIGYDRVVLATGSRANIPTLAGVPRSSHRVGGADDLLPRGVTALRDLDDGARIRDAIVTGQRIVVLGAGVLAGFPVVDVKVQLIDGAYHEVDSSALAFEIASRAAFREALQKGTAVLLEPIMKVEVVTPEDYTGSVIGDLNSRRGQIQGQDMRGNANVINAMVPLANMFGYVNTLRSFSQGRATFTMQFDHYEQVPSNVAQEVQAKYA